MPAPPKSASPLAGGDLQAKQETTEAQIIGGDLSAGKPFRTLQALFALRGLELNLIRRRGGCSYLEARCHLRCWHFASLHDAQAFLARQPGGDPA